MEKTDNKILMNRGSKSSKYEKLTKQLHAEKQTASHQAKDMLRQYYIVKPFHKAISDSYCKKGNTENVWMANIANSYGFCGKVLFKAKDYIWRIF